MLNMSIQKAIRDIDEGVRARFLDGNPVELHLRGHHPDFEVEETRYGLSFSILERSSINLVGSYSVRNIVTIDDPVVIYDGAHYYSNDIFGSFVSTKTLNRISSELGLPYTFSR